MFAAIKNNKTIVTGQSKSQVRRILTQKGLGSSVNNVSF